MTTRANDIAFGNDNPPRRPTPFGITVQALLLAAVLILPAPAETAQSVPPGKRGTADPIVSVSASEAGIRISIPALPVSRHALLLDIVRLTGTTVRNLELVPDDEICVEVAATPLDSVLNTVLEAAGVAFAIQPASGSGAPTVIVFGPASPEQIGSPAEPSAGASRSGIPETLAPVRDAPFDLLVTIPAELPAIDPASRGPVQLHVRPIERPLQTPMWRPIPSKPPVEIPVATLPLVRFPLPLVP